MPVAAITTHVQDALARLLTQYQGQPLLAALIESLFAQTQSIEDVAGTLQQSRSVKGSFGAQLDALGTLVGLGRGGADDTTYHALLYGVIGQNFSDSTSSSLLGTVAALFLAQAVYKEDAVSQGIGGTQSTSRAAVGFDIGSPALPVAQFALVQSLLLRALPAGVGLFYLTRFNAAKTLACAGPQAWVGGLGDVTDPSVGAPMARVIYNNTSV